MAESFLESLKKDFARKGLYDVLKYSLIAVVTLSATWLASVGLSKVITSITPYLVPLVLLVTGALLFIFLLLSRRFNRFRPVFPRLDVDYQLLKKEVYYEYKDRTHMICKKKYQVKALKNGLDTFRDKYFWTGKGTINIKSGIPEQQVNETIRKTVWQVFEIRLQRALKKGESVEMEVIWELEDAEMHAAPFLSTTIEEPTDLLVFILKLPSTLSVRDVVCEVACEIGASKPFDSFSKSLDREGCVKWEIDKPLLLYYYEIRWHLA